MRATDFTPGTWERYEADGFGDMSYTFVRSVSTGEEVASIFPDDHLEANARFIAQSPETFEALRDLVDWVDPNENMDGEFWQLDSARAAIAKALGKPTKVEVTS